MKAAGLVIATLCLIVSCTKEDVMTYEGKEQIYFRFASQRYETDRVDSMYTCLGYDNPVKTDSTIAIRIMTMGATVDFDRPVNAVLVDSLSTATSEDIEVLFDRSFITAGSVYGYLRLKIKNSAKLTNTTYVAVIQTVANEYFYSDYVQIRNETNPGRKQANRFWVYFDAKNEMPNLWAAELSKFNGWLGEYSRVKFEFVCETLGLTREYFSYDPETENSTAIYTARFGTYTMAWLIAINRRLNQYEEEHGERLKDEHGNEVKTAITSIS